MGKESDDGIKEQNDHLKRKTIEKIEGEEKKRVSSRKKKELRLI